MEIVSNLLNEVQESDDEEIEEHQKINNRVPEILR